MKGRKEKLKIKIYRRRLHLLLYMGVERDVLPFGRDKIENVWEKNC
jgi:hypothetical protein